MSHLSTFKNNSLGDVKENLLQETLREIGLSIDFTNKRITTDRWAWKSKNVDGVFMQGGNILPIGVVFTNNSDGSKSCEIVGDFYGTGLNEKEVNNKIAQYYVKNDIIEKCENQGWNVDYNSIETNKDGEIVFEAHRYA